MPATPSPRTDRDARRGAVVAAAAAVASFLLLRRILAPWGVVGTAVAEWMAMVGVPVAWVLGRGVDPRRLLRVGPAAPGRRELRGWAAALLVGGAGIPVVWLVTWLQGDWLPPDPTVLEGLRVQLLAGGGLELVVLLAAAALTPAVCEELLFRGVLLDALLGRWPPRSAVLLSGLAFGLLHWVPGGGFRVLPTAAVGALLGWLAWRTGSVVPAMAAHLVHNTLVLVSAAWAVQAGRTPVWGIQGDQALPPPLWLALAGVAILAAACLILRERVEPEVAVPPDSSADEATPDHDATPTVPRSPDEP